jgi:hypothetical protein
MKVDGRENIFSLIKQRFPSADPVDKVLDWTLELSETRVIGMNVPNALGLADFGSLDLIALEALLRGTGEDEQRAEIEAQSHGADTTAIFASYRQKRDRIASAAIFRPLLDSVTSRSPVSDTAPVAAEI